MNKKHKYPKKRKPFLPYHVIDELGAEAMREKAKQHHVLIDLRDKSPEAIAARKQIARLGQIIRL